MTFPSLSSSFLFFAFISVTLAFDVSIIQMEAGICPYTVVVMTSCLSPESTRDEISIAFGDADGNQVYAPSLGGSVRGPGRLGKCSTDTFQVKGQCLDNPICSVSIYRNGTDGWVPESIEIYSEASKSVKFDLNKTVPQESWYGVNNCNTTGPPYTPQFPPPEYRPETPVFPPPPPPRHDSAASSRRADVEVVFLAFAIAFAVMMR